MCSMFMIIFLTLSAFVSRGVTLNSVYETNFTFRLAESPIYINKDVIFQKTSNVFIEHGVEIIFGGGNKIIINGNINCGCYQFDTLNVNKRGLANESKYINIEYKWYSSSISINYTEGYTKEIMFCNTKFSNFVYALQFASPLYGTDILIDSCLFETGYYALYDQYESKSSLALVTDSKFIDIRSRINNVGGAIYDNCEFDGEAHYFCNRQCQFNGKTWYGCCKDVTITNSKKLNSVLLVYYTGDGYYEISNNLFKSAKYGVVILQSDEHNNTCTVNISNNIFTNISTHGILTFKGNIFIENNLFVNNEMFVDSWNFVYGSAISCGEELTNNINGITIKGNTFESNTGSMERFKSFRIIYAYYCGEILEISHNIFVNNSAYQVIVAKRSMGLSHNQFVDNNSTTVLSYYGTEDNGSINIIHDNHFQNNIVSNALIDGGAVNTYFTNNVFENNIVTKNWIHWNEGYPLDRLIDDYSDFVSFVNNSFINNQFPNSAGGDILNIEYYFEIKSNIFYSDSTTYNIDAYINADNDYKQNTEIRAKNIEYNNFYHSVNINYFITNRYSIDIKAQNNYFDSYTEYNDIASKVYGNCEKSWVGKVAFWPWFANEIIDGNITGTKCRLLSSWSCNYNGDVFCGDTKSPTTAAPTENPITYAPTENPITYEPSTIAPTENPITSTSTLTSSTLLNTLQTTSLTNGGDSLCSMICLICFVVISHFM